MLRVVVLAGLSAAAAHSGLLPLPRLQVTPVHWEGQTSPAFAVQCVNDSDDARELIAYIQSSAAIRLDGVVHETKGFVGSLLSRPGETPQVAAGSTFTQVVVLGQSPQQPLTFPAGLGYSVITSHGIALTPGEHSVAFTCWSEWTHEVHFLWAGS
jgi:hypothetical protein